MVKTLQKSSLREPVGRFPQNLVYSIGDSCPLQFVHIYTPGIYSEGYIVFVFPFVRSYVRMFVRSFVRSFVLPSVTWNLRQSFASKFLKWCYLSNYSSEIIHIWTIVTLEGWHSLHDRGPQGPCPGVGLEVKI